MSHSLLEHVPFPFKCFFKGTCHSLQEHSIHTSGRYKVDQGAHHPLKFCDIYIKQTSPTFHLRMMVTFTNLLNEFSGSTTVYIRIGPVIEMKDNQKCSTSSDIMYSELKKYISKILFSNIHSVMVSYFSSL